MNRLWVVLLAVASMAQAQSRWQLAPGHREDSFQTQNLAQFADDVEQGRVGDIPSAGADAIPFGVQSYGDVRHFWQLQRPLIDKHFETRALKAWYVVPRPPLGLFTSQPVQSGPDFDGTRVRSARRSPTHRRKSCSAAVSRRPGCRWPSGPISSGWVIGFPP